MPKVTLHIKDSGQPVGGAIVYAGETLMQGVVANSGGIASVDVAVGYAAVMEVLVEVNNILRGTFGPLLLKASSNTTLDIGATHPA